MSNHWPILLAALVVAAAASVGMYRHEQLAEVASQPPVVKPLQAQAAATFPDGRYANLFVFLLVPAFGHTVDENQKALDDLLVRFESQKVDAETLARVKTKVRAGLIRRLASNAGLASMLTAYYGSYGDWRKLFTSLDDLNKVTADDVQRVALKYFDPASRTVAYTVSNAPAASKGARPR
jgi:predicted Zn-dependent peptidase